MGQTSCSTPARPWACAVNVSVEPGRPIVAAAAITVYTVGIVKHIPDVRTYVAVDGGMSDNPRPVLYGSGYEAFLPAACAAEREMHARLVGKHCENGDVLIFDARSPTDLAVGDLLANPVTGAYGPSMASNYNKLTRPPVVFVRDGQARARRAPGDVRGPGGMRSGPERLPAQARAARSHRAPTASVGSPVHVEYTPALDGDPDPGEVVWAWVAYEDDPSQGKDRPSSSSAAAETRGSLVGIPLTSKRTSSDPQVPVGTGPWDREGRPSYARIDRVLDLDASRGARARCSAATFRRVVAASARASPPVTRPPPGRMTQSGDNRCT